MKERKTPKAKEAAFNTGNAGKQFKFISRQNGATNYQSEKKRPELNRTGTRRCLNVGVADCVGAM